MTPRESTEAVNSVDRQHSAAATPRNAVSEVITGRASCMHFFIAENFFFCFSL